MSLYQLFNISLFFFFPSRPMETSSRSPGTSFLLESGCQCSFSSLPLSSPPMVTKPFSLKDAFLRLLRAQSDIEEHLRAAEDQDTRNIWGCVRECREWGGLY